MPPELPRPNRRTTLTQLCETLVPAWFTRYADAADPNAPSFCLQLTVDGDTQHLVLAATGPTHHKGPAQDPHLCITCDNEAWRTAMEHLAPLVLDELDKRHSEIHAAIAAAQPKAQSALQGYLRNPGTVQCTYIDDAGDEAQFTLRIGAGNGPTAQVRVDDAKLHTLRQKRATPAQILSSVEVKGDVAYLTKLAQAMGAL